MPVWVSPWSQPRLRTSSPRPISTNLARPNGVRMILEGLMSRWTTPRCDACTKSVRDLQGDVDGLRDRERSGFPSTRWRIVTPSMYSNAM